jgi:ribosome recycling factor
MQMGRQKITDQYVSQIDEYLARMKQLTGRKKGGEVEKDE